MSVWTWVRAVVVAGVVAAAPGAADAQPDGQREAARALARLMMEDRSQPPIEEQVGVRMMQSVALTLQERLNRRLQEVELQRLAAIVRRFVEEALPPGRSEAMAAEVYVRHFDEAELRELLAFQTSPVGRKAARLAPTLALETAQALEREVRESPATPGLLAELRRVFPVLGPAESP
jgi:hypothetical protein